MLRPYQIYVRLAVIASCTLPLGVWAYNVARTYYHDDESATYADLTYKLISILLICVPVCLSMVWFPRWIKDSLESASDAQGRFLDSIPIRWVDIAILASAALSLYLELSLIRWQGSIFEVFAFYKNFGLLSCFLGLGLGYALSGRPQLPLIVATPLLVWQFIVLTITRQGPDGWSASLLRALPVKEQLHMGAVSDIPLAKYLGVFMLLIVVLLLTALALMPVGQLCGRLLDRRPKLTAYGWNLLGSLLGVALLFGLSLLWTPPIVWFGLCFVALLAFQTFNYRPLLWGGVSAILGLIALSWPVPMWEQIHSPYQLIERGPGGHGMSTIRAAGHFYQKIYDFSAVERDPDRKWLFEHYAFPYRFQKPGRVAVVGAGTGNDAAMAVRMGAEHVDAIEIDPAIMAIGGLYHPDDVYHNPKVSPIVNDARSFLRTTDQQYDTIVYGLLDSHTLLSHGSNVRLDSFVYTVEAFREARDRLVDGGILSLSFTVLSPEQGRKIYLMLQEAFGTPPTCLTAHLNGAYIFLERKGGKPVVVPPELLKAGDIKENTEFASPELQADMSTDDWPFFYMPRRVYPMSYVIVLGLILLTSVILVAPFMKARPHFGHIEFFLLGAGFMLVETKGITELGLTFGNTWQVIGIVISGILLMAFLANLVVQRWQIQNLMVPYILLLAVLLGGIFIIKYVGFEPTVFGRTMAVIVLTCPLFFSGMVFSTLLKSSQDVSGAMASNLIGAMCGGFLEYNSMYFGFLFLYWIAIAIYGAAFIATLVRTRARG